MEPSGREYTSSNVSARMRDTQITSSSYEKADAVLHRLLCTIRTRALSKELRNVLADGLKLPRDCVAGDDKQPSRLDAAPGLLERPYDRSSTLAPLALNILGQLVDEDG